MPTTTVRLPLWWLVPPALLALGSWALVVAKGGRSTPWLGCSLGLAVGFTLFTAVGLGQRVRVRDGRLSGHAFLRRSVDLGALTTCRVGGNPLPGGARSNQVLLLEDERGGRVTVPLAVFPASGRAAIAALLREPVLSSGALELDDPTRGFLETGRVGERPG
ncbi:MAG: hypothetical protein ACM3OO_07360 [Planctomycetaceae bacterium]